MAHATNVGAGAPCPECRVRMQRLLDEANPAHPAFCNRRVTPRSMSGVMAGHTRAVKREQRRIARLWLEYEAEHAPTSRERQRGKDALELLDYESQRVYFDAALDRAYMRWCYAGLDRAVARYVG